MDNITLGQLSGIMVWLIGFGTATLTIVKAVKSAISKSFVPIEKKIDDVDLNATKNFLVRCIADIDRNGIDPVTKMRFYEQFEHYQKMGGNSYIRDEVERLKKEGKL